MGMKIFEKIYVKKGMYTKVNSTRFTSIMLSQFEGFTDNNNFYLLSFYFEIILSGTNRS